jgi:hypothetical protein
MTSPPASQRPSAAASAYYLTSSSLIARTGLIRSYSDPRPLVATTARIRRSSSAIAARTVGFPGRQAGSPHGWPDNARHRRLPHRGARLRGRPPRHQAEQCAVAIRSGPPAEEPSSSDEAALSNADAVVVVGSGPWPHPDRAHARRGASGPAAVVVIGGAATPAPAGSRLAPVRRLHFESYPWRWANSPPVNPFSPCART